MASFISNCNYSGTSVRVTQYFSGGGSTLASLQNRHPCQITMFTGAVDHDGLIRRRRSFTCLFMSRVLVFVGSKKKHEQLPCLLSPNLLLVSTALILDQEELTSLLRPISVVELRHFAKGIVDKDQPMYWVDLA